MPIYSGTPRVRDFSQTATIVVGQQPPRRQEERETWGVRGTPLATPEQEQGSVPLASKQGVGQVEILALRWAISSPNSGPTGRTSDLKASPR